jgi:hypothetical protein
LTVNFIYFDPKLTPLQALKNLWQIRKRVCAGEAGSGGVLCHHMFNNQLKLKNKRVEKAKNNYKFD